MPHHGEGVGLDRIIPDLLVTMEPNNDGDYVCDGVEDDEELQAAIDELVSPGGWMHVKGAQYNITEILTVTERGLTMTGDGHGIVTDHGLTRFFQVVGSNLANIVSVQAANFHAQYITIDGNKINNPGAGSGWAINSLDGSLENIGAMYCKTYGINNQGDFATLKHCFGEYCDSYNIRCGGEQSVFVNCVSFAGEFTYGIRAEGIRSTLLGCRSYNDILNGFQVDGDGISLLGCNVRSSGEHGFVLDGADNCNLIGCIADRPGISANNTFDGFHLQSDAEDHCERNIFIGNQVYSDDANLPRYGVNEADANQNHNQVIGGHYLNAVTAPIRLQGVNSFAEHAGGYNPQAAALPAVGASPVTFGPYHYPMMLGIVGGTITSVTIRGQATGQAGADSFAYYHLYPGDTAIIVYTVVPVVYEYPL